MWVLHGGDYEINTAITLAASESANLIRTAVPRTFVTPTD
jgi:hypothetical protein